MTTFTTEDRINYLTSELRKVPGGAGNIHEQSADLIKHLQEKIEFLQSKNKWLMQQVEQLEIQIWGSR